MLVLPTGHESVKTVPLFSGRRIVKTGAIFCGHGTAKMPIFCQADT